MTDFARTRTRFHLPEGLIYLDGNSLGPLPKNVPDRIAAMVRDEWGEMLIGGWNRAGWMAAPARIGDRIGRLIGAERGHVVMGDTLSIKVFQALAAALRMRPDRRVILSDTGNFPSDLYMAQGLVRPAWRSGRTAHRRARRRRRRDRTRRRRNPADRGRLPKRAAARHGGADAGGACGRCAGDLGPGPFGGRAAGRRRARAVPTSRSAAPTSTSTAAPARPAFIYVAPRHAETAEPALSGWLGHDAPFEFDPDYRPGAGIERMRVGTPPMLQLAALDAALDVWDDVDMAELRARSVDLQEIFIAEVESRCPDLALASPRDPARRGSQVSFRHAEGYAIMQALIARGVIGDFRAPDILRFGFTPLYIGEEDVRRAAATLGDIIEGGLWDRSEFRVRAAVT